MLIFDGHLDLAWNALYYGRDLTRPIDEIRKSEVGMMEPGRASGTVSLPEMRRARVALCFATVLARSTGIPVRDLDYPSVAQAYASTRGQLAYYRALEAMGEIHVIEDANALNDHLAAWDACDEAESCDDAPVGVIISMEGADSIISPDDLSDWHAAGLRIIGPAHFGPGRYAGGTGTDLGLTELGFTLLDAMKEHRIALDLAHLSDPAFWQALEHVDGPILASHCNCRALVPGQRQLSDEQIRAIIERNGVMGAVLDDWMLKPGFIRRKDTNDGIYLSHVVDHIDHVCQLAGNANHVAIGSDLDGLFGLEQCPCDMDSIVDVQRIAGMLAERGYGNEDIAQVMFGNWRRWLRTVL